MAIEDRITVILANRLIAINHGVECFKQKPTLGTWEKRIVKIDGKALNFYNHGTDWAPDIAETLRKAVGSGTVHAADGPYDPAPRGSSIPDVTGYTVTEGVNTSWFVADKQTITLTKDGENDVVFSIPNPAHHELFFRRLQYGQWPDPMSGGRNKTKKRRSKTKRRSKKRRSKKRRSKKRISKKRRSKKRRSKRTRRR